MTKLNLLWLQYSNTDWKQLRLDEPLILKKKEEEKLQRLRKERNEKGNEGSEREKRKEKKES